MTTTTVLNAVKNEKLYTAEGLLGRMGLVVNRENMKTMRSILHTLVRERSLRTSFCGSEITYFKK